MTNTIDPQDKSISSDEMTHPNTVDMLADHAEEGVPVTMNNNANSINSSNDQEDAGAKFRAATGVDEPNEEHHRRGFAVPSTAEEIEETKARWGENTWQLKAMEFINSKHVQHFFVGLLIMDVFILCAELGKCLHFQLLIKFIHEMCLGND